MHYEQSRTTAGAGGVPLSQDTEQRATYEELVFLVDVTNHGDTAIRMAQVWETWWSLRLWIPSSVLL